MLTITIPESEFFDDRTQQFIKVKGQTITLEHSLISLSKWESKWKKPFLSKSKKTGEEIIDYIRCMTITQNVDPKVYLALTKENIEQITKYIEDPMSAKTFYNDPLAKNKRSETITNELIYYWMVTFNIPFECEKWHLNRLIALVKTCSEHNAPPKKLSKREMFERNKRINEANKKRFGTRG